MSADVKPFTDILGHYFGHPSFRGSQIEVIQHVAAGKHALVIMPTGMGKSICYQIPALHLAATQADNPASRNATSDNKRRTLTLVISPLIALMKDQVDALSRKGISATFVNSSLTRDQRNERYRRIGEGEFDLVYVTPERFRKT